MDSPTGRTGVLVLCPGVLCVTLASILIMRFKAVLGTLLVASMFVTASPALAVTGQIGNWRLPTGVWRNPNADMKIGQILQNSGISVVCEKYTGVVGDGWWYLVEGSPSWPGGWIVRGDVARVDGVVPNCDAPPATAAPTQPPATTPATTQPPAGPRTGNWPAPTGVWQNPNADVRVGQVPQNSSVSIVCQRYTGVVGNGWWYLLSAGPSWPGGWVVAGDVINVGSVSTCTPPTQPPATTPATTQPPAGPRTGNWPAPTGVWQNPNADVRVGQVPQNSSVSIVCQRYTGVVGNGWWYLLSAGPSWPAGWVVATDVISVGSVSTCEAEGGGGAGVSPPPQQGSETCSYKDGGNGSLISATKGSKFKDSYGITYLVGSDCSLTQVGDAPPTKATAGAAALSGPSWPGFSGSCRSDPSHKYIAGVEVSFENRGWMVRVWPTRSTRNLRESATSLVVSLLYDCGLGQLSQGTWDALRQQVRCHARWQGEKPVRLGGDDWGLESWRPVIDESWISSVVKVKVHKCNWDSKGNHAP